MDKLNSALRLPCGLKLGNRLAKVAMTERRAKADHNPNRHHYNLYSQWGQGGPGLIITGNIMIDRDSLESGVYPGLWNLTRVNQGISGQLKSATQKPNLLLEEIRCSLSS